MSRPKVVIARHLGAEVMAMLDRPDIDVVAWPSETKACHRKWLLSNVVGATGLLIMLSDKVDAELLDAAGAGLRVVSTMSVGYEHVDVSQLGKRGIRLGYTPDILTEAVADVSVMLALMVGRDVGIATAVVRNGEWPNNPWAPFAFCGPQLSANSVNPIRTAGFIGFGRIAQATLTRLVPFGFTHCVYTGNPSSAADPTLDAALAEKFGLRSVRRVALDELARESDVVFVLAPGGQSTFHVVNEAFLKQMKNSAVLVNTSRGPLVDSDALAKACRERWIWGAGVDVVEGEPNITVDHPLIKEPRCIVLPHIGSATTETRLGMATLAVKNLLGGVLNEEMPTEYKFT
ncbi:Glyoxylate reductase 1 [Sparassis crispa]|uniref:Glyoxylate reductase 1 n=1 Tax=Sparassis crispa TaxID=139825 RepID=A0A401GZ00_9APHY|nr:Glyoxylate reductase 1 [Sparassis crispa]GBE87384.1 Glyoxylate reductase 1 [Sparassis crispa]